MTELLSLYPGRFIITYTPLVLAVFIYTELQRLATTLFCTTVENNVQAVTIDAEPETNILVPYAEC